MQEGFENQPYPCLILYIMLELCVSYNKNQFGKSGGAAFYQFSFVFFIVALPFAFRIRSGKHTKTPKENTHANGKTKAARKSAVSQTAKETAVKRWESRNTSFYLHAFVACNCCGRRWKIVERKSVENER